MWTCRKTRLAILLLACFVFRSTGAINHPLASATSSVADPPATVKDWIDGSFARRRGGGDIPKPALVSAAADWKIRSACAGVSCFTTWSLTKYMKWSAVRASSVTGLLASLICAPPLAAASLSGAFCGMSGYLQTEMDALGLAVVAGLTFALESHKPSILVGKGGRLGAISVLASVIYLAVVKLDMEKALRMVTTDIVDSVGGPTVASGVAIASVILYGVQKQEKAKNSSSFVTNVLKGGSKVALIALLTNRWISQQPQPDDIVKIMTKLLSSASVMFACSLYMFCLGATVFRFGLLGLAASFVPQDKLAHVTIQMCMGGLIGMTKLPGFSIAKLLETSLWLTMLLQGVGGFTGIGGRLGALTVIAVVLANLSWGVSMPLLA